MTFDSPPQARPLRSRVDAPASVSLPDAGDDLRWRRVTRADLPALLEFDRACGAVDHPRVVHTLDMLEEGFDAPAFDPETDSAIAFDAGGRIVAYGEATTGSEASTLVKVRLDGKVHPSRRREGIGTALLAWQEARGLQLLAASESDLPGWLNAGIESRATAQRALLESAGFVPARWWLTMDRDLRDAIPEVELAPDLRIAPFADEWSESAREVINDAFRDHWGTQPLTPDDWGALVRLQSFRPELSAVVLAKREDDSEDVVGVLGTMINEAEWEPNGFRFGYIEMLGVARGWRGRRIAQALLAHTLRALRAEGLERAVLDVDSESPTGAVGLYSRLGFRELDRSVTVVKEY